MSGKENMMTHGDPYRIKVIACKEVSFTIVLLNLFLRGREKRNILISAR